MATVVFYEKPGCRGNAHQKGLLEASGHTVIARNILKTDWMRLQLLPFLQSLPVSSWFNRNAPLVKSGAVDPDSFDTADVTTVLSMMIENPILIRRPLLEVDGVCRAGFDAEAIHQWIGLSAAMALDFSPFSLENCRHGVSDVPCEVRPTELISLEAKMVFP